MRLRMISSSLIAMAVSAPALLLADPPLPRAAERYEEAVEELEDVVAGARVDAYVVRLVKSLERLADRLEETTDDRDDAVAVQFQFRELASTHERVRELLAGPYVGRDRQLTAAVRELDSAWYDLSAFFVPQPHRSHQPHHSYYGAPYPPVAEPLPPPPPRVRSRGYAGPPIRVEPHADRGYGWQRPPAGYGWSSPPRYGYGRGVERRFEDRDDYEDYLEDLDERAEDARERREEQYEEWRERRDEALEERRERFEDYFDDDDRRGRPLRRIFDWL